MARAIPQSAIPGGNKNGERRGFTFSLNPKLGFTNPDRLAQLRSTQWKDGLYSAEALAEQKRVRELLIQSRELLKQMQAG